LARFDGHTNWVFAVTSLDWPGLDHPVVVTASFDETARVWDPQDPATELARFDAHTNRVRGVISMDWPGVGHPVVVTTSADGTARVWDPQRPGTELMKLPVFGTGYGIAVVGARKLAVATSRGLVILQVASVAARA
jgi:WD40 repeat protein